MQWAISLNPQHVAGLKKALGLWLGFVAFGLVLGAGLGPRPDEIAFMVLLPLPFVAAYATWCFLVACLKLVMACACVRGAARCTVPGCRLSGSRNTAQVPARLGS